MKKPTVLLLCVLLLSSISCGGGSGPQSPSPDSSVPPGERSPIVRGVYDFQNSTCANNGSQLQVMQNLNSVYFKGGFTYGQQPVLADYDSAGYVDSESQVHFTIEGSEVTVTCVATLIDGVFGGICRLPSGDVCDFVFSRPVEVSESESGNSSPTTSSDYWTKEFYIDSYDCGNGIVSSSTDTITRKGSQLEFEDGISLGRFLEPGEGIFSATVDLNNKTHFQIVGKNETVTCDAVFDLAASVPSFSGTCDSTKGYGCQFVFKESIPGGGVVIGPQ